MNSNVIIKSILEVIGEPQLKGGYTITVDNIDVPIFLNKDSTTRYPEVVVSPFILREDLHTHNNFGNILKEYVEYEKGVFQVDIFSKNLAQCDNIFSELKKRIYDFSNLEILHHRACIKDFEIIDNNIYKNMAYACNTSILKDIYHIEINGKKLSRVLSIDKLINNTYYCNDEALYIKTDEDFKKVNITVITQGRLFKNKDSLENRGIIYLETKQKRYLSDLENNEVERISVDLYIVFGAKREREKLPTVDYMEKRFKRV